MSHAASAETRVHRTDIDGLRAIAVLSVIAFHAGVPGFSGGYIGVDVFFVISGFLICGIIVRELDEERFSIVRFYERRAKRILPALFAVLLFCLGAGLLVLSPYEAKQVGRSVIATALSVSNVRFWLIGNYFDGGGILNPLLMTWSLAVEEQFYFVFPLLLALLYQRSRRYVFAILAAGCVGSCALCIYLEFRHPSPNFYLPFSRAWEIGAGALLALWGARTERVDRGRWHAHVGGGVGLLLIGACVWLYSPATRFPGYEAIAPVLGTVLLLRYSTGFASRLLSLRPLAAIGLISYSLYLWHWPLLSFAAIIDAGSTPPVMRGVLMLLAGVLAALSYLLIERPFRAARARPGSRTLLGYGGAILAMVALGGFFVRSNGVAARAPALARAESLLDLDRAHDCIRFADKGPNLSAHCVPPASAEDVVALLGDSHAEAVEATLRAKVKNSGRALLVLTSFACPPLLGVSRELPAAPQHARDCARFNGQALDLVTHRPDVKTVVLLGSWAMLPEDHFTLVSATGARQPGGTDAANLLRGLTAEIDALESAGKAVIVIDDWPSLDIVPLDGIRYANLPVRRFLAGLVPGHATVDPFGVVRPRVKVISSAGEDVRTALMALAQHDPKLRVIDSKQTVCDPAQCRFGDGGGLLYTDAAHMSDAGAKEILAGLSFSDSASR